MRVDFEEISKHLEKKGVKYKVYNGYIMAQCLNPGHLDRTPSMAIYQDGYFYCFGCGWKGKVNEIFKNITSMETINEMIQTKRLAELVKENLKSNSISRTPLPSGERIKAPIRNFPPEFLSKYLYRTDDGLIFPIFYDKKPVGYTKKLFSDGRWIHSKSYIFGKHFSNYCYPFFSKHKIMILVEGVFDFLRLRFHKLPAYVMFGANFNQFKAAWVLRSAPECIVMCFDGDEAGKQGAEKYVRFFKKYTYVINYRLPNQTDPDVYFSDPKNVQIFKNFVIKLKT